MVKCSVCSFAVVAHLLDGVLLAQAFSQRVKACW